MYAMLLIIAVAQIIIEMIPVSSSGHVLLLEKYGILYGYLPFDWIMPEWFEYLLNIPTIFVLIIFFWSEIWSLKRRFFIITYDYLWKRKQLRWAQKKWLSMIFRLIGFIVIVDILTVGPYFICKKIFISGVYNWQQGIGFLLTASALFSLAVIHKKKRATWCSAYDACMIGLSQVLAVIFKCSRFGITLAAAHALGFSFRRSVHFSFLTFFPLLLVASLKGLIFMPSTAYHLFDTVFCSTIILAALISYIALHAVWWLGERGYLWSLGFYMIVPLLAIIFL